MADEMGDDEFLSYCLGMATTPRCGFVPAQIARLIRLSGGREEIAVEWEGRDPTEIRSLDQDSVREAVAKATALAQARDAGKAAHGG